MKTVKDLRLLYTQETGEYAQVHSDGSIFEDSEYAAWLEEKCLSEINKSPERLTQAEIQLENITETTQVTSEPVG